LIQVMHVITSLNIGGAELMLERLIEAHSGNPDYRHTVVSLKTAGKVGEQLKAMGIEVQAVEMHSLVDFPRALWHLVRLIRRRRPDVVQTWLYHADLLGGLAARLAGNRHVIWGVRCTAIPQRGLSLTRMVVWLCSLLSQLLPMVIVCCAESARTAHAKKGYAQRKMIVISNGYNLRLFNGNPNLRQQARAAFGFGDDEVIVGVVGRFDPLKDFRNFVISASALASKVEHVKFLMVGPGLDFRNQVLRTWIDDGKYSHKFVLAGESSDVPKCLAALDVFCLSSSYEGFPNVVCEAMAMGVPCVVTDVGDAARIVSDTGIVVAARDSIALAEGLQTMLSKAPIERARLGELARRRIQGHYSIETISAQFDAVYDQLADKLPSAAPKVAATN
jgi:glycosyltransferase involved in cell wall biosynthesis